jgi:hypothetical protein
LRGSNDVTITASVARAAAITSAVRAATSVRHQRGRPELDLDVDRDPAGQLGQHLVEAGDRLGPRVLHHHRRAAADRAVREARPHPQPGQLVPRQVGDRAAAVGEPIDAGVVEHHRHAVGRQHDVELDRRDAQRRRAAEAGQRVLLVQPRHAAVADHHRARGARRKRVHPTTVAQGAERTRAARPIFAAPARPRAWRRWRRRGTAAACVRASADGGPRSRSRSRSRCRRAAAIARRRRPSRRPTAPSTTGARRSRWRRRSARP